MNRGADHQVVFRNDDDRRLFIALWERAVTRFGIVVVAFALLDNHYHILVKSPQAQLSRTLQFIGRSYTQQFNYHHGRDGALFRGRFHSIPVDTTVYFERVARYIELNPVAAGIVPLAELSSYQWSSFRFYANQEPTPGWLSTSLLLAHYGGSSQYCRFVQSSMTDGELDRFHQGPMKTGLVLGKEAFAQEIRRKLDHRAQVTAGVPDVSLEEIDAAVLMVSGALPTSLRQRIAGRLNVPRSTALELAHLLTGTQQSILAERYGFLSAAAVSNAVSSSRRRQHPAVQKLRLQALASLGRGPKGLPLRTTPKSELANGRKGQTPDTGTDRSPVKKC